jgi:hypothetical protein
MALNAEFPTFLMECISLVTTAQTAGMFWAGAGEPDIYPCTK